MARIRGFHFDHNRVHAVDIVQQVQTCLISAVDSSGPMTISSSDPEVLSAVDESWVTNKGGKLHGFLFIIDLVGGCSGKALKALFCNAATWFFQEGQTHMLRRLWSFINHALVTTTLHHKPTSSSPISLARNHSKTLCSPRGILITCALHDPQSFKNNDYQGKRRLTKTGQQ